MNKVYKVVWCEKTQTMVAVSEFAKSKGKSSSKSQLSTHRVVLPHFRLAKIALALMSVFGWQAAMAANPNDPQACYFDSNSSELICDDGSTYTPTNQPTISTFAATPTTYAVAAGAAHDVGDNVILGTGASGSNTSVAIGAGSTASGTESTALGKNTNAIGWQSVALGNDTFAKGRMSIVLGTRNNANNETTATDGNYAIAIGSGESNNATAPRIAEADGNYSIAFGTSAKTTAGADSAVAIGHMATINSKAKNAVAIGNQAFVDAKAKNTVVIGNGARAEGEINPDNNKKDKIESAVVIGDAATSTNLNGIAIGHNALADAKDNKAKFGSIAMGHNSAALGRKDSIAIGTQAQVGVKDSYQGQSIAIGSVTRTFGDQSTAIGNNVLAQGNSTIAIGGDDMDKIAYDASKDTLNTTGASGYTMGQVKGATHEQFNNSKFAQKYRQSTGQYLVGKLGAAPTDAIKDYQYPETTAKGEASIVVGTQADATGAISTAVGTRSSAGGFGSVAFGVGANAVLDNSVALGAGSGTSIVRRGANGQLDYTQAMFIKHAPDGSVVTQAFTDANEAKAYGEKFYDARFVNDAEVPEYNAKGQKTGDVFEYSGFAGGSNYMSSGDQVSVGMRGFERQIKHVAPANINKDSTDAVNGSQLFSLASSMSKSSSGYFHTNENKPDTQIIGDTEDNFGLPRAMAGATGAYAVTAGKGSHATREKANAMGFEANALNDSSVAIGNQAIVGGYTESEVNTLAGLETSKQGDIANAEQAIVTAENDVATKKADLENLVNLAADPNTAPADLPTEDDINAARLAFRDAKETLKTKVSKKIRLEQEERQIKSKIRISKLNVVEHHADNAIAIGKTTNAMAKNGIAMGNEAIVGGFTDGQIAKFGGYIADATADKTTAEQNLVAANNKVTQLETELAGLPATDIIGIDAKKEEIRLAKEVAAIAQTDVDLANKFIEDLTARQAFAQRHKLTSTDQITDAIAYGTRAAATANDAIAFGTDTKASVAGGVALGSDAVADRTALTVTDNTAVTHENLVGNKVYALEFAKDDDKTAIANTVKGNLGAVSVGVTDATDESKTKTRQIINVAAGRDDSDAVNVAQLKAVANTELVFSGNDTDATKDITRRLGEKLTIKGGHSKDEVSDKNLYVKEDKDNNALIVQMAEKPEFTEIKVGSDINNPITIGSDNNGKNQITGLGDNLTDTTTTRVDKLNPTDAELTAVKGNAATVNDILNSGWNLQGDSTAVDFVNPYDTVNFIDGNGTDAIVSTDNDKKVNTVKFDIKADSNTLEFVDVDAADPTKGKQLKVKTVALPVGNTGSVTKPTGDNAKSLATAGDIADAINNSGFIVTSSANGGTVSGNADKLINPSKKVEFIAGKHIAITQTNTDDGATFKFETDNQAVAESAQLPVVYTKADGTKVYLVTKPDGSKVFNTAPDGKGDDVDKGDVIASMNNADGTTATPTALTNVKSTLPNTVDNPIAVLPDNPTPEQQDAYDEALANAKKSQAAPTFAGNEVHNAATISDVLSAGWNLQGNGDAVDFVKPYDTINFIDGVGTTAKVTSGDNLLSKITFDINPDNTTVETENQANGKKVVKDGDNWYVANDDGTADTTQQVNKDDVKNVVKAKTSDLTVNDGSDTTNTNPVGKVVAAAPDSLATAGDIAKAINNSGFIATSATTANGKLGATATNELINPSDTLTFEADKNIKITQANGKFTFATKDDVEFKTIKLKDGENETDLTSTDQGLSVGGDTITNVGSGLKKADGSKANTLAEANQTNAVNVGDLLMVSNEAKVKSVETVSAGDGVKVKPTGTKNKDYEVSVNADTDTLKFINDTTNPANGKKLAVNTGDIVTDTANKGKVKPKQDDAKKVANVGDVADAINSAGWVVKTTKKDEQAKELDLVTAGNSVNFVEGDGITITPTVDDDNSIIKIGANVDGRTIKVNKAGQLFADIDIPEVSKTTGSVITIGENAGTVTVADGDAFLTANETAKLINGSFHTVSATNNNEQVTEKNGSVQIGAGDTLNIVAGKNINANMSDNGTLQLSTASNVEFDTVKVDKGLTVAPKANVDMGGNQIHNVGAGTKPTDAVNVSQLKRAMGNINKDAYAGSAAGLAAAGLPQPHDPGANMVSAAIGTYHGETALAVGLSAISDNGKWVVKGALTQDTADNTGGSLGVGYQW